MVTSRWTKKDEGREGDKPDIRALIAEHFEVDIQRVTDAAHFAEDFGADWLDRLELLIIIEEHFPGMEITEQDAEQLETVGALIRYLTCCDQRLTATNRAFNTGA